MPLRVPHTILALAAASTAALALPGAAVALDIEPGQVVVRFEPGSTATSARASGDAPAVLKVTSVKDALRGLRSRPDVAYAAPDVKARVAASAGYIPNDPGRENRAGGWQDVQWNFSGPRGVNAPGAWAKLITAGAPGGRGAVGRRARHRRRLREPPAATRSPDFTRGQFVRGYDFVDDDPYPARPQRPRHARRRHASPRRRTTASA